MSGKGRLPMLYETPMFRPDLRHTIIPPRTPSPLESVDEHASEQSIRRGGCDGKPMTHWPPINPDASVRGEDASPAETVASATWH